jgi:hypothetical protein
MIAYNCGLFGDNLWWDGRRDAPALRRDRNTLAQRESSALRKMENSGNEAKKYLKTKEVTILNAANFALFARRLTPIAPQKEQKNTFFCENEPKLWSRKVRSVQ